MAQSILRNFSTELPNEPSLSTDLAEVVFKSLFPVKLFQNPSLGQEKKSFKVFSIFSPGGHLVQLSRTV